VRRLPLVLLAALLSVPAAAAPPASVEPKDVAGRLAWADRSLLLLDVRTPEEFAEGHLPGAINIPHTELAARIGELSEARSRDVVVYCRSGRRSLQALGTLEDAGFTRLLHLKDGFLRWSEEERPVTRSQ
jgi:phage shock protein E